MSGQKRYSLRRSLRDTLYGKVFLGLDNHTNHPIIIKQCSLWHVRNFTSVTNTPVREDAFEEIRLHQELSADEDLPVFVLKLLDVVQDDENLFIILEFARGGEMFSYIQGRGRPDPNVEAERVARLRQQHELDLVRAKRQIRQQQQQQEEADAGTGASSTPSASSSATTSASMNDDDETKGFDAATASASSPSASSSAMHDVTSSPSASAAAAAARHILSPTSTSTSSGGGTPAATNDDEMKGEVGTPSTSSSVELPRAPDLRHPFEIEACRFMRQLVEGVRYIHKKFICHRDLSLENLLLDHNNNVKIIDFGVACGGNTSPYANGDWTTHAGRVGKVGYMAPEVWDGQTYDGRLADVWSMGVIFFIMLVGCPPYEVCRPDDPRFRLIIGGRVDDLLRHWGLLQVFSPEAIDLLQRMFRPESERITVDEMVNHRFFANQSAEPLGGTTSSSSTSSGGTSGGGTGGSGMSARRRT